MRDSVVVGRIGKRKGETKRHRSHHELFSGGTLSTRSSFLLFFCPQSLRPDCPNVAGRSSVGRWPIWSSRSSFSLPLKVRTPCGSSDEKEKQKRGGGVSQKTVVAVVESFSTHVAGGGGDEDKHGRLSESSAKAFEPCQWDGRRRGHKGTEEEREEFSFFLSLLRLPLLLLLFIMSPGETFWLLEPRRVRNPDFLFLSSRRRLHSPPPPLRKKSLF